MEKSIARHEAISRLTTKLDRIMEETEYILKGEHALGPKSFTEVNKKNYSSKDSRDLKLLENATNHVTSSKFQAVDVLLQILQKQEELTVEEYKINNSTIKVLVIEDTEF